MDEHTVRVQCSSCGHVWDVDLREVETGKVVIVRSEDDGMVRIRVQCPQCDKFVITRIPETKLP